MRDSAKPGRVSLNGDAAPQSGESGDPIVGWTTCGTARWMIDASGCLTIAPLEGEESGELEDWREFLKAPWYGKSSSIISAKIEGAIAISTATGMFCTCSSLKSLDLSGLDASKVEDMSGMFFCCSKLSSLDLSGLDTSNVTDMSSMFGDCRSLKSLDLTPLDTSNVTDMSSMFGDCRSLKSLDLSGLDTLNVTDMFGMFKGCASLQSLDLTPLDTSKVTGMSRMFWDCRSLTSLDLSGLDASSVEDMSHMFENCSSFESLYLSGLDASSVTDMSEMFKGCSKLSSLDLSGLDTSNVEDMSRMFENCSSLESLDLSGLDASGAKGMSEMFKGCSRLSSLDLSGLDTSNVEDMSAMFDGCPGLRTVTLGEKFSFVNPYPYPYGEYDCCCLPWPRGESLTGKWLSSANGKAYEPEAVPNNVAATYTAQTEADISNAAISGTPAKMTATGSQLALELVVTFNGERLVEGEDYTVSYGDNIEPGVGAGPVTVSATKGGNFTGFVTVFFDIEKKITFPDVDYDND